MEKIKVIYILGPGKNGSTLLERLIGSLNGFFPIGEIPNMWSDGFENNFLCSCGTPFMSCKFWERVNKQAIKDFPGFNPSKIESLRKKTQSIYKLPYFAIPSLAPERYKMNLEKYKKILIRFYRAISENIPNQVIVDSSKNMMHCLILCEIPEIELYVIDLLRDSRAIAFSWQRKSPRPDVYQRKAFMKVHPVATTSRRWLQNRLGARMIKNRCKRYKLLKYEDLINNPDKKLLETLSSFGFRINQKELKFLENRSIKFKEFHTVSGNPMRFIKRDIKLIVDDQWKTQMSPMKKLIVTILTYPLLKKYKYIN